MVRGPPPNYPPPSIGLSISLHVPHRLVECLVASVPLLKWEPSARLQASAYSDSSIMRSSNQVGLNASATGRLAARIAGNKPPTNPSVKANPMPSPTRLGVTASLNTRPPTA
jgi:hypothetical protein